MNCAGFLTAARFRDLILQNLSSVALRTALMIPSLFVVAIAGEIISRSLARSLSG